jgi:hypothetical protein
MSAPPWPFNAPTIHWPANPADILNPRASRLTLLECRFAGAALVHHGHFPLYTLVLVRQLMTDLLRPPANAGPAAGVG